MPSSLNSRTLRPERAVNGDIHRTSNQKLKEIERDGELVPDTVAVGR